MENIWDPVQREKNCGGSVRMEGVKDVSLERQGGMIKQ